MSDQYLRYRREFGAEPPYPANGVTCYYFLRRNGTIARRIDLVLTPAACRYYRIWVPQSLERGRAERIATWMAVHENQQHAARVDAWAQKEV